MAKPKGKKPSSIKSLVKKARADELTPYIEPISPSSSVRYIPKEVREEVRTEQLRIWTHSRANMIKNKIEEYISKMDNVYTPNSFKETREYYDNQAELFTLIDLWNNLTEQKTDEEISNMFTGDRFEEIQRNFENASYNYRDIYLLASKLAELINGGVLTAEQREYFGLLDDSNDIIF